MNEDREIFFNAMKEFQDVVDDLHIETYIVSNHELSAKSLSEANKKIKKLEEKETKLAKEISYALYRILDNKGKIYID